MEILRAYEVPVGIVDVVNMMYTNTTAQVLSPNGDAEYTLGIYPRDIPWHLIHLLLPRITT